MNPSLLTHFSKHNCPAWVCPACGSPSLSIQVGTFNSAQTAASRERMGENDSVPEDMRYVFSCLLKCERSRCEEVVAVSGTGYECEAPPEYREQGGEPYLELYQATLFEPPLPAFSIPAGCPDAVARTLKLSFSLFLIAPGAAANTIRIALEELMTALRVKKMPDLHRRIKALPGKYSVHQDALMAIKILGNTGSHVADKVAAEDIEQAYQIIEFVLGKIYEGSTENIRQLVKRMSERFARTPL